MTKNDISNLILKGDSMSILEHDGLYYISCFRFNNREDLAVFYSHKEVDNYFICISSKGSFYIVVACFIEKEEAEKTLEQIKNRWYIRNFPQITFPTKLNFCRYWYDEDYIQEHFPDLLIAEKKLKQK